MAKSIMEAHSPCLPPLDTVTKDKHEMKGERCDNSSMAGTDGVSVCLDSIVSILM